MDLKTFAQAIRRYERTESLSSETIIMHGAIGLVTELPELLAAIDLSDEENVVEEAGDCAHYLMMFCARNGIEIDPNVGDRPPYGSTMIRYHGDLFAFGSIDDAHELHRRLVDRSISILDHAKRRAIYGKPFPLDRLSESATEIVSLLARLCDLSGGGKNLFNDALPANVEKLRRRYPNGAFSSSAAIERADKHGTQDDVPSS